MSLRLTRKHLSFIFVLLLLLSASVIFYPSATSAQDAYFDPVADVGGGAGGAAAAAAAPRTTEKEVPKDNSDCGLTNMGACVVEGVKWILNIVRGFFAAVTVAASIALDIALKVGIQDLRNYIGDNSQAKDLLP